LAIIQPLAYNLLDLEGIAAFCAGRGVEVVGRIHYDDVVTEAVVQGQPVTEYTDGPVAEALQATWERVKDHLDV
jgi:MinD superfamily P-loop ATPase